MKDERKSHKPSDHAFILHPSSFILSTFMLAFPFVRVDTWSESSAQNFSIQGGSHADRVRG
jgi:hypothetical protein